MSKLTSEFRKSALRRGMLVENTRGESSEGIAYAGSIELANLGFVVNPADLRSVSTASIQDTIKQARSIMGADRDMTPIYPGFPKQVQELSTMTLLVEQILHYWTAGALLPDYPSIVRDGLAVEDMLRNARTLRVVRASEAARELVNELVSSPIAISVEDKALLKSALLLQKPSMERVVETAAGARNAENIQSFIMAVAEVSRFSAGEIALAVIPVLKNSDAVLRVALALFTKAAPLKSNVTTSWNTQASQDEKRAGNYTLAVENLADRHSRAVYMLNMPRPVRRAVIEKLGKVSNGYKADALVTRRNLWRKLMTAVHPYDFNLTEAQKRTADIIHSNVEYKTLNALVEEAMENRNVKLAVDLLAEYQPGNLLRRLVALMRMVDSTKEAKFLAKAVRRVCSKSNLTTLVSSYNGVIAANDDATRVTRVAGIKNTMVDRGDVAKVNEEYLTIMLKALKKAMVENLANKPAPVGVVGVKSTMAVPLVRRDAATADREMSRGAEFAIAGEGDTLRVFSHWKNNQREQGYMDIGLVILDEKFNHLAVLTWDSWSLHRELGTYSGDKLVYPGHDAAEYFDLELSKVRAKFPKAIYAAMTIQSYTGWPTSKVDIIAGAMLRSKPESGEVFDARTISTAFKPTTDSTQSVPLAIDLRSGKLLWIDSSNGSSESGVSSTRDNSIGSIVYDELERPRLTLGELAVLWAKAHGAEIVDTPVDQNELSKLL